MDICRTRVKKKNPKQKAKTKTKKITITIKGRAVNKSDGPETSRSGCFCFRSLFSSRIDF